MSKAFLKRLYRIRNPSGKEFMIFKFLCNYLDKYGYEYSFDEMGNIYIRNQKADRYILLNAHMDSIMDETMPQIIEMNSKIKSINKAYLGCDDKNGIYAILQLLKENIPFKAVITTQEETGCNGISYAVKYNYSFFDECVFNFTIDRKGNSDIITHNHSAAFINDKLREFILGHAEIYGYSEAQGILADLGEISAHLLINSVNVSCGYYLPHTTEEYTIFADLTKTINLVADLSLKILSFYDKSPESFKFNPDNVEFFKKSYNMYYDRYYAAAIEMKEVLLAILNHFNVTISEKQIRVYPYQEIIEIVNLKRTTRDKIIDIFDLSATKTNKLELYVEDLYYAINLICADCKKFKNKWEVCNECVFDKFYYEGETTRYINYGVDIGRD